MGTLQGELLRLVITLFFISLVYNNVYAQGLDDAASSDNPNQIDNVDLPDVCTPELIEVDEQVIIDYDPFAAGAAIEPITFAISNLSNAVCELDLSVSLPDMLPSFEYAFEETGVKIDLRVGDKQQGLSRSKVEGVFFAVLAAGESREFNLNAVVYEDAVALASDHILGLDIELNNRASAESMGLSWRTELILRSLPRAQVNLSGTIGAYGKVGTMSAVDFGIAKQGASRLVFVQLRANTLANLTVKSLNKGVLKHSEKAKKAPVIPYTAKLEDEILDLSEDFVKTFNLPKTYDGKSFPLILTLGDPKSAMSGKYSDIIIFEFSPL